MPSAASAPDWFFFAGKKTGHSSGPVQPLHVDGRHFKTPDGQIVKLLSISAFRAYQRFLQGRTDELGAYLSWWVGLGGNCIRVFFTHGAPDNDKFLPWDYPAYYGRLSEFFGYVAAFGLYTHATCLTGQNEGNPEYMSPDVRERHVRQIATAAGTTNLVEYLNEAFKNGGDALAFGLPAMPGLCCRSCFNWDSPKPDLQWSSLHPERKDEQNIVRKIHDLIEIPFVGPCIVGEPGQIVRDVVRPDQNRTSAILARTLGEGYTVHGSWDDIQQCKIPTGKALECVLAACDGWQSGLVPDDASAWNYLRDEAAALQFTLGGPSVPENSSYGAQHIYGTNRGGAEIDVIVEPTSDFRHEPKGGWRIVRDDVAGSYLER